MIRTSALVRVISWFVSTSTAQSSLEYCVKAAQYLMGIGSGTKVGNGEWISLKNLPPNPVILDVGANIGQYAHLVRKEVGELPFRMYCFEPSHSAYETLLSSVRTDQRIVALNLALANAPGHRALHFDTFDSGGASLTKRRMKHFGRDFDRSELVRVDTLDDVCRRLGIEHIDLLKIDVEGHELDVLTGAETLFARHAISRVQFEFGGCNIDTRTYFQDFYYFLSDRDMMIYRITPSGYLRRIFHYREMDEQFRTTNFLACLKEAPTD